MYLFGGAALHAGADLLLRLLGRQTPKQPWQEVPGGFRAGPRPGHRIALGALLLLGVLLLLGTAVTASSAVRGEGGDETWLLAFVCFLIFRELIRSSAGPVLVSPDGVSVGERRYPWSDVHQAYLAGDSVELRVQPRWITWFGDRRVYIRAHAYVVPAAEIHWLIQHYLLFPAERERMDRLPTRAYELPA